MQLLIILALLMFGGNNGGRNVLEEVKPVLESLGGEEIKQALKSAEELTSVISAVQELTSPNAESVEVGSDFSGGRQKNPPIAFPLSPVSEIADKDITYSLSRYIAQN